MTSGRCGAILGRSFVKSIPHSQSILPSNYMKIRAHTFGIEWIAVLTASIVSSCATVTNSNDSICSKIEAFERAPFNHNQTRRSVTLKWVGDWMDFENGFGKNCEFDSADKASKELCA